MYKTIKPGYAELPEKKQEAFKKQIKRYVTQSKVLWLLYNHVKGLLITAPQFLNTKK
jgi:GTP-binding protein EngB required for normal cell division